MTLNLVVDALVIVIWGVVAIGVGNVAYTIWEELYR